MACVGANGSEAMRSIVCDVWILDTYSIISFIPEKHCLIPFMLS